MATVKSMNSLLFISIISFVNLPITAFAQSNSLRMLHLTTDQGLSQNSITSILQDERGILWFGTPSGLNRFDGYAFKVYKKSYYKSLSDNFVRTLAEDSNGILWIATKAGGLNRFDPVSESFQHTAVHAADTFKHSSIDQEYEHTANISINAIVVDEADRIWLGTDNGLQIYDRQQQNIRPFTLDSVPLGILASSIVTSLLVDNDGIWLGGEQGLFYLNYVTDELLKVSSSVVLSLHKGQSNKLWVGTTEGVYEVTENAVTRVLHTDSEPALSHNWVRSLKEDEQGNLWIGTNYGLNYFNKKTQKLNIILPDPSFPAGINSHSIDELLIDKNQVLWIGTNGGGINKLPLSTLRFLWYRQQLDDNTLKGSGVYGFFEDSQGFVWVLHTRLQRFDPATGNFDEPYKFANGYDSLVFSNITSVVGLDNEIWLGSGGYGLIRYRYLENSIVYYKKEIFNGLPSNGINRIIIDKDKTIWVYTDKGLVYLDVEKNQFKPFYYQSLIKDQLSKQNIHQIIKTSSGELWLATDTGIYRYKQSQLIQHYLYHADNSNSLSSNIVNDLLEDSRGDIWIATNYGLNKFSYKNNSFKRYFVQQGLTDNAISGITEDKLGRLWITTIKGLSLYTPATDKFTQYFKEHGLQDNEFSMGAIITTRDNKLLLGGTRGFNMVDGNRFEISPDHTMPLILSLKTTKKSVAGVDSWHYPEGNIELEWSQNSFHINFTTLDTQFPWNQQYFYFLSGFDSQWMRTNPQRRFAYYGNLKPGFYTFHVSTGLDGNNIPYAEKQLHIQVHAPWWLTKLAYFLYFLLFLGLFYLMVMLRTRYLERRTQNLAIKVAERTAEISKQKDLIEMQSDSLEMLLQQKNRIFANISHEFRTPLTLILGPLKKMLKAASESQQKELNMLQRNAYRLLRMVDQLLDISRLQTLTELEHKNSHKEIINIADLLDAIISPYQAIAQEKDIQLDAAYERFLFVNMRYDAMEKIIGNLLSNAIKYTFPGGIIKICARVQETDVMLSVKDNGIGIPHNDQDNIFKYFVRVDDDAVVSRNKGTGIGLALVKEIVESHDGELIVNSTLGEGSEFLVRLPVCEEQDKYFQNDAIELRESTSLEIVNLSNGIQEDFLEGGFTMEDANKENLLQQSTILIVDDNPDMRHYLCKLLTEYYKCYTADNGREAVELARQYVPNIIVSDIMMPDLDGYQLCRKLKEDYLTSHIPLIFLTALTDRDSRLIGLKEKADDYLTKPFDSKELLVRIENLLSIRESFKQYIHLTLGCKQVTDEERPVNIKDQEFIEQFTAVLEENYRDVKLNLQLVAQHLCITERQLQRKLKALFGQSINEIVRIYRIEKAVLLLKKGLRVEEVAYQVGFASRNYFGTCFKAFMGKTPKQFQQEHLISRSDAFVGSNTCE